MVGVLCQPNRKGATMTQDHRRPDAGTAQGILLDDVNFLREIVERVLQEVLEAEMTEHVGAAPHERTDARKGHRNGHKPRTLRTRVGTLNLLVPQDREGSFSTKLFSRCQRNEKALVLALMEMYLEGVSTRKVKDITEELCGISFSKSLVSSLAGRLDSELEAWRDRRLEAQAYPYVFVDARYEKVRSGGRVVSQGGLGSLGGARAGWLQGDLGGGGCRHRERGYLPGVVPLPESSRPKRRRAGDLRRPRGPQ